MNLNSLPIFHSQDQAGANLSQGTDYTMQNKMSVADESCQRSSQYQVKHTTPCGSDEVYSGTNRSSNYPVQSRPSKQVFSPMNLALNQHVSIPSKVVDSPQSQYAALPSGQAGASFSSQSRPATGRQHSKHAAMSASFHQLSNSYCRQPPKVANGSNDSEHFEETSENPTNVNMKLQRHCLERLTSDSGSGSQLQVYRDVSGSQHDDTSQFIRHTDNSRVGSSEPTLQVDQTPEPPQRFNFNLELQRLQTKTTEETPMNVRYNNGLKLGQNLTSSASCWSDLLTPHAIENFAADAAKKPRPDMDVRLKIPISDQSNSLNAFSTADTLLKRSFPSADPAACMQVGLNSTISQPFSNRSAMVNQTQAGPILGVSDQSSYYNRIKEDFITFKPPNTAEKGKENLNVRLGDLLRPTMQKLQSSTSTALKLEDLTFTENMKSEAECYQLPLQQCDSQSQATTHAGDYSNPLSSYVDVNKQTSQQFKLSSFGVSAHGTFGVEAATDAVQALESPLEGSDQAEEDKTPDSKRKNPPQQLKAQISGKEQDLHMASRNLAGGQLPSTEELSARSGLTKPAEQPLCGTALSLSQLQVPAISDNTVSRPRADQEEVFAASGCTGPPPNQYARLNLPSRIQEDSQELSYSVNESQQVEMPSPTTMEKISASEGDSKEQSPSQKATRSSEQRSRQLQQLQEEYLSQESLITSLGINAADVTNKEETSLHREDTSSSRMYISDGQSHEPTGSGKNMLHDIRADSRKPPRGSNAQTFIQNEVGYSNMLITDESNSAVATQKEVRRAAAENHFAQASLTSISTTNQAEQSEREVDPVGDGAQDIWTQDGSNLTREHLLTEQQEQVQPEGSSSAFTESTSGMQSMGRDPANMKEYYEMQMRGIKNQKKRRTKQGNSQNQVSFARSQGRNNQSIASTPQLGAGDSQHQRSQRSQQTNLQPQTHGGRAMEQTQWSTESVTEDDMYRRGILWKKKLEDINHSKAQIAKHVQAIDDMKECTFQPKLATSKYNRELINTNVTAPAKSGETAQVGARCNRWLKENRKKKESVKKQVSRQQEAECTFSPVFLAKKFKNKACSNPQYANPPKFERDMQAEAAEVEKEHEYFTLKNYLLNDQSQENLSKLYEKYKSGAPSAAYNGPDRLSHEEKLALIDEFLERSKRWQCRVQEKREALRSELERQEDEQIPFHPQINFISACLHEEKIKMLMELHHTQDARRAEEMPASVEAAPHTAVAKPDASTLPRQMAEGEARDNSTARPQPQPTQTQFSYYLPQKQLAANVEQHNKHCRSRLYQKKQELENRILQQSQTFESRRQTLQSRRQTLDPEEEADPILGSTTPRKEHISVCEECAEKLEAAKKEGIDYFGEANDFRGLVDTLQAKLASSAQTLPEEETCEANPPQMPDPVAQQQPQISSTNLKNLFQPRQEDAVIVADTLQSFTQETTANAANTMKLDRLSLLPRQAQHARGSKDPEQNAARGEVTAWAYGSLGRPTNAGALVPPPGLPCSSASAQSHQSMQSSPGKTMSHQSEETSHFNVSLERGNTVAARASCSGGIVLGEDALSQDGNTMTLTSNHIQAHHHATPTLTDPVILVTTNVEEAAQHMVIQPYQKQKHRHEKQMSSEEEQEPCLCPVVVPEPAPKQPRLSDAEDFTPAKVLVDTYINEHQRQDCTGTNASASDLGVQACATTHLAGPLSDQQHASSAAKAVGQAPRPQMQITSRASTPTSIQRTRSSASASRNQQTSLTRTPSVTHAHSHQYVDLNLVATRRSVGHLEEFCRRVQSDSEERRASRRSRGSASGSASRSNHSKKTVSVESIKRKMPRKSSNQSKKSAHSASSRTPSRKPGVPASALDRSTWSMQPSRASAAVDTVTDCPSELTPCAMNASDLGTSALVPASEEAKTIDHQASHQDAEVCQFRAGDNEHEENPSELATITAQPSSARVYVPHKLNPLEADTEYSRLSKKLRELKLRQR